MSARTFTVGMSERCFRFKPDALPSHAPQKPGVYEFVTFKDGQGIVLFVGLALDKTVFDALSDHLAGRSKPTAADLFAAAKDVYFDYVVQADIDSLEDLKDVAGAMIAKSKPALNVGPAPSSGKYTSVELKELG